MKDFLNSQVAVIEAEVAKMPERDQNAYFRLKREFEQIAGAHTNISGRVLVVLGLKAIVAQIK